MTRGLCLELWTFSVFEGLELMEAVRPTRSRCVCVRRGGRGLFLEWSG